MKKVFLDDLPKKYGFGANEDKKCIDWENSVGCKVKFIYDNIEGEIEIINYNLEKNYFITLKYNDNIISMYITSFVKCNLGSLVGKHTKKYKYNIGDIITTNRGQIEILEQVRTKDNIRGYKYRCLIDNNIDILSEYSLKNGYGCSVCSNLKVLKGVNDLWTTHPEIAKMLKHPEKGYELTYGSPKINIFVCPNCGYEKSYTVNKVTNQKFACDVCSDGISYPNKFIRAFLEQVGEEYIPEYLPSWIKGKKSYDNLLPNRCEIWEVHGRQHYEEANWMKDMKLGLELQKENDKYKKLMAEQNGFKYIEIDARYSNSEYIKNSLLNLPEIKRYDLSKVDWIKINDLANNSLKKIVCNFWNNNFRDIDKICKKVKLNEETVRRYLREGSELGWCNYSSRFHIIQLTLDDVFIREWETAIQAANELNISNHICDCCKGKRNISGGYKWMYKEDYEEYIKEQNKTNINSNIKDCQEQSFSYV